jgi:hypothetical protein
MALVSEAGACPRVRKRRPRPITLCCHEAFGSPGFGRCGREFPLCRRASLRISRRMRQRDPNTHSEAGIPPGVAVVALLTHEGCDLWALPVLDLSDPDAGTRDIQAEPGRDDTRMLAGRGAVPQSFLPSGRGVPAGQSAKRELSVPSGSLRFAESAFALPRIRGREQLLCSRHLTCPRLARDIARQRRGARRSCAGCRKGGVRRGPGPVCVTHLGSHDEAPRRDLRRETCAFGVGETALGARLPWQPNGDPDLDLCLAEPTVLGEAIGCVAKPDAGGAWCQGVGAAKPRVYGRTLCLECPQFGTQRSSRLEGVSQGAGMCRCDAARQDGDQYQPDQHWNPFRIAPDRLGMTIGRERVFSGS